jgi:hypothetical protein
LTSGTCFSSPQRAMRVRSVAENASGCGFSRDRARRGRAVLGRQLGVELAQFGAGVDT